ncbi:MAG: Ig-like domain-containing protein, partial [Planctomycetaceae bacterium]
LMDFDRGQQTFVVDVAATDAGGQQSVQVVRVQLTDVNDEAPQLTAGTLLVAEDANDGTVVGRVTATDLDTVGGPLRFEIQPGGLGVFDIDSSTGDLIVANSSGLDHEVSSEIEVTVEVSDGVNSTIETLTVRVGDENESPTGIELGSNSFSENAIGVVIGDLTVLDVDSGDTHTFEVDDQRFEVVAGTLQLRDDVSFDYESDPTVTILVTATDEDGLSIDQTFELTVLGINEAPVGISITNDSIRENVKGGRIGRLAVADEDVADRHAFSVNDSRFEIVDAGLRLKPGIALDFETEQFVDVEITAVDQDGLSIRETIRIDVENRTIQVTDTLNRTVEEDTPAVTWDLSSVFEDDAGDLTFEVDSTSELGRLKLVGTKLVFQPRANAFGEERIRIVATASDSEAAVANLLLEISPVNDAPVATGPSSTVVLPGGLTFNPLAAENAFDIDDNSLTAVVVGLPQNGELTVEADGRFTYVPNEDFSGADVFSYEVRDAAGLSSRVEIELTVGGVGFQPQTVVEDAVDSSTESGATDSPLDSSVDSEATVASDSIDQPSTPAEAPPPSATSDQEQKKNIFNPLLQESGDSEDDQELVAGLIPLRGGTRSAEEAQRRDSRGDILGGSGQGSDESSASSESRAVAQSVVQQQARILSKKTTTQLDQALDNVTEDLEKPRLDQVVFGTASVSLGGFSVGYIIWLLRGGSLVASMLTSIPAWRMIDPLPVLDLLENSDEDGDSLDTLIDRNQKLVSANSSLANQEGK